MLFELMRGEHRICPSARGALCLHGGSSWACQ
ncbi:hypothetical protein NC651_002501 [Populus alba x Populus x berolinensis]|nr:hypothetical protein NC651_002501 [Populus alba x Populus x berolinensis]